MFPLTGSEELLPFEFVHCWWKWTVVPVTVQSTVLSVGGTGWWQLQAVEQMSIVLLLPWHVKVMLGQQLVPEGTPATAETQTQPVQPGGTGFGAGVRS
jgi:hypothetical protein